MSSSRSLTVLGTASQAPTRHRNHNGYLVRFDDQLVLFDPGEGTQRQATIAGASVARLNAVCLTHFHGDHCLGLPGVIQTLNGMGVERPLAVVYPADGETYFSRLRYGCVYTERTPLEPWPVERDGAVGHLGAHELIAAQLDHRTTTYGYRIQEPDHPHIDTAALAARGISGPIVGCLVDEGEVDHDGETVRLEDVAEVRRGQSVAVVMDTRPCENAAVLADRADLLVVESTFLDEDRELADRYCHMTARQAGELAAAAGARSVVLTHFSQRYQDPSRFVREARQVYDGPVVAARDFDVVDVPRRSAG